jgi:tetratricopeptide (TPR) repeat protein
MRFLLLFLLGFLIANPVLGQIETLKGRLNSSTISVSEKLRLYNELSEAYWKVQLDSSEIYADKAIVLARKLKNPSELATALIRKAIILTNSGQEVEAFQLLMQAKSIAQKNNLKKTEALVYNCLGKNHKKDADSALYYYNYSLNLAKKGGFDDLIIKNKIQSSLLLVHQKRYTEVANLFNKIIPQLEKKKDYESLMETYLYMSLSFRDLNEKSKSLLYADKAMSLLDKTDDKKLKAFVLGAIGGGIRGYFDTFESAEPLLRESLRLAKEINDPVFIKNTHKRIAILYYNNDNLIRSAEIFDSLLPTTNDPDVFKFKGVILSHNKKYKEAKKYLDIALDLYEKEGAYIHQKFVLQYLMENKLEEIGDKELTNTYFLLDSISTMIHDKDNIQQFIDMETKFRTAEKEAEIKQKELDLAKSENRILWVSGFALLTLGVGGFMVWFLRNRQKRKELEFSNRMFELQNNLNLRELESLNHQLNPHEVKNLITSIAPEIITKAPDAYKKMIKLFNVTRASLSHQLTDSLEAQVQQVDDFLQLQQSISPYVWEYEIQNDWEDADIEIPRLLLKNMVENSVKHGLKSLKENGKIILSIQKVNEDLVIHVKDNGIGIEVQDKKDHTGIGFSTYENLFKLANKFNDRKASIQLYRQDDWTITEILIPLKYKYQKEQ